MAYLKREEFEKFLGKKVKIKLFDGDFLVGELHKTGEAKFKNDANLFIPKNRYFVTPNPRCVFRCSHVIKIGISKI